MNKIELSVPGKVFLAGEYLALEAGPTLVAAIGPRFKLTVSRNQGAGQQKIQENIFHPQSPAGKFFLENSEFLKNYHLEYFDPYQGQGGFGGSTAEYILLSALVQMKDSIWGEAQLNYDLHYMLQKYRELCASHQGLTPSGADLVSQVTGQLTYFDRAFGKIQQFGWSFDNLGFFVAKTTKKTPTHEHLMNLQTFPIQGMTRALTYIHAGLTQIQSEKFIQGLTAFTKELYDLGFVSPFTQALLNNISHPSLILKKGCGALGSDVVLIIYDKSQSTNPEKSQAEVLEQLQARGLGPIYSEKDLQSGLMVKLIKEKEAGNDKNREQILNQVVNQTINQAETL